MVTCSQQGKHLKEIQKGAWQTFMNMVTCSQQGKGNNMKRTEMYKALNGKRVTCMSKTQLFEDVGIFKSGRMRFTITHFEPLERMEYAETTYYLYKDDIIEDKGEYILIRGDGDRYIRIFH